MRIILFLVSFVIVSLLTVLMHYYGSLFFDKDEYKRSDFTNLAPLKKNLLRRLLLIDKSALNIALLIISLLIPYALTATMHNWFINSVLLLAALYYIRTIVLPKVSINDSHLLSIDIDMFLLMFGFSLLAGITLNWITYMNTSFLFFVVNFFASIILLYYILNSVLHKNTSTTPPDSTPQDQQTNTDTSGD